MRSKLTTLMILAIMAATAPTAFAGKPLKVFIMDGQSDMQGTARVSTIERLNMTEDSKQMCKDIAHE